MAEAHTPALLLQGAVYLGAAVLAVPLSKRLGLGSVLGYLSSPVFSLAHGDWG